MDPAGGCLELVTLPKEPHHEDPQTRPPLRHRGR
jgi:hypothetical protein